MTDLTGGAQPLIVIHDMNALRTLDAELTLRAFLQQRAEVQGLNSASDVIDALSDARVALAFLDGDAPVQFYQTLSIAANPDPRVVWMRERFDRLPIPNGVSIYKPLHISALRSLPAIAAMFDA